MSTAIVTAVRTANVAIGCYLVLANEGVQVRDPGGPSMAGWAVAPVQYLEYFVDPGCNIERHDDG